MSPVPDLLGCAAKMRRAQVHLEELERQVFDWIRKEQPYRAIPEFDPQTGHGRIYLAEDLLRPLSELWGPLVGDLAHNLMSALDHLICQLAVAEGKEIDCERTEFPVCIRDDPESQRYIRSKTTGLATGDVDRIRDLQPYKRGKRQDKLWLLNRINNIDKHRRLLLSIPAAHGYELTIFRLRPHQFRDVQAFPQNTKAGQDVARFRVEFADEAEKPYLDLKTITQIVFDVGDPDLDGESVLSQSRWIFAYVRDNVFPTFEDRVGKLPPL